VLPDGPDRQLRSKKPAHTPLDSTSCFALRASENAYS
jgi:hypothetical protein